MMCLNKTVRKPKV